MKSVKHWPPGIIQGFAEEMGDLFFVSLLCLYLARQPAVMAEEALRQGNEKFEAAAFSLYRAHIGRRG